MSLINDMLRDLDQRNSAAQEPAVMLPRVAQPLPRTNTATALLMAFAALAVAAVLAGVWWFYSSRQDVPLFLESAANDSAVVASGQVPVHQGAEPVETVPAEAVALVVTPEPALTQNNAPAPTDLVALPESLVSLEPTSAPQFPAAEISAQPVANTISAAAQPVSQPVPSEPQVSAGDAAQVAAGLDQPTQPTLEQVEAVPSAAVAEPVIAEVSLQVSGQEEVYETSASPVFATSSMPEMTQPQSFASVRPMEKTPVFTAAQRDQQAADQASELWQAGQALEAENLVRLQVAQDNRAELSRALLAQMLMAAGRLAEAEGVLAAVNTTSSTDLRKLKARVLQAQGQPQAALTLLRERTPAVKDDADFHVVLAALFSQLGLFDDAVNTYAGLVSFNGKNADWWAGLGIALEGDGQLEPARRAYQQATSLTGLHPQLQEYVIPRLQALQR